MSATLAAPARRRIQPIPTTQLVPSDGSSLATLDRRIQVALQNVRDEVDSLLESPFVPTEEMLELVDEGMRQVRASIASYQASAAVVEREATANRSEQSRRLQPVRIERDASTAVLYRRYASRLGGEVRYLYRCPLADPATGVCVPDEAPHSFGPCARPKVHSHIERWHLPRDPLDEFRHADTFWFHEGAQQTRQRAHQRLHALTRRAGNL